VSPVHGKFPESRHQASWTARSRGAGPPSRGEHERQHPGEPAWLEYLSPTSPQGQTSRRGGCQVAIEVIPAIKGPLVAEPTVELEQERLFGVLDVTLRRPLP
jgi:hypothetical protein